MRQTKLPDYRLKQKILFLDKTSDESFVHYGDLCAQAGAYTDALDFYTKARHTEGMEKIRQFAMSNGDTFLFQQATRALGTQPSDADWEQLAQKAARLKKFLFARQALAKITDAQLAGALKPVVEEAQAKQDT
ncbi:MAG: hypothetical protein GX155_02965 [Smithella sp.]|nr:hypothetical protein [Smithella sp.]